MLKTTQRKQCHVKPKRVISHIEVCNLAFPIDTKAYMLSNTFIGSEFVEICFRFLRGHVLSAVIQYHDQCFAPDNVAYGTTNQCLAPGNVAYGTTTSAFHLAMCHTVPRPGPFTWHYVMWYHDQCISHGNVSYGKTTSAT